MTVADLYRGFVDGGGYSAAVVIALPIAIALLSMLLKLTGHHRSSQMIANAGIAIGLTAISVEVLGLAYAMDRHGVEPFSDISIPILLAPLYLLAAAVVAENIVHPGPQEVVRKRLRGAALTLIAIVVGYWVLSRLYFHMLVLTSLTTFFLFIAIVIGILYYVARRFI